MGRKKYKELYETELKNRKFYEEGYRELKTEYINMQKEMLKYQKKLKFELAQLKFDLQDTRGFLKQEKQVSNYLRNNRRKTVKQKEEVKNG